MRKEAYRAVFKRNAGRALPALLVCAAVGAAIVGCTGIGSDDSPPEGFRITQFMIEETEGVIDQDKRTIEVVLPYGTEIGEFEPKVEFVGARIDPAPETVVDFSEQPVKYTVFSKDGSAFAYLVTVTTEIPHTKEILSFELEGVITAEPASITDVDEETGTIEIIVPYGTNVSNRTAVIVHSGDSINPVAGKPQDFRPPVTYEVYSLNGEKRVYTVTVIIALNTEADITEFELSGKLGVIIGSKITITVPYGTSLASLTPTITVSDGASVDPIGPQNFSAPVLYIVTAADGMTTKAYTVMADVAKNDTKEITSFTIAGPQVSTVINENENKITVTLPANMSKNPLTPTIIFTGSSVTPASGVVQNFTNPLTYTVTASDNTTKDYTVTVINAPPTAITFNSVKANGEIWTRETTALTLQFSKDMGDALKAEHITLTPASGNIKKGTLTNKGSGKYELLVSNIPGDNLQIVQVSVTVAENSVYGFTITGSPRTTNVYKAPLEVNWDVKKNGTYGTENTTMLTFTLDRDIPLTEEDIILYGPESGAVRGTLSGSGKTRTLTLSGIKTNNADLLVTLSKAGFAFNPGSYSLKVYTKLGTDAALKSLTMDGFTLDPVFATAKTAYTVEVVSEIIYITAIANDPNSRMVYEENSNATVTSGEAFNSKPLTLEGTSTVTIKVTAADGTTTKRYTLTVKHSDFPAGTVINQTFTVNNTAQWEGAVNTIKSGGNNKNYVINATESFDVAGASSNTFGGVTGITVVIRGSKTIGLSSKGNLLRIGANQSVILRDITFMGRSDNNETMVSVLDDGKFEMRGGAKITGNTSDTGGGVEVNARATFTMRDNASVSSNTGDFGGGVNLKSATFTMWNNASVSGNTAFAEGGGVVAYSSTVIMRGNASISGNTSDSYGGGVYISGDNSFTMRDNASVSGNTTFSSYGGGVYVNKTGTFRIAGGTVYGSNVANGLKNTAPTGAALYNGNTAEYGTGGTDGEAWASEGTLNTTDYTFKVVNGVKQ